MIIEHESIFRLYVKIHRWVPARPAPACSNPSDPAFADCGDPAELEYTLYIVDEDGLRHPVPECLSFLYEETFDTILEAIND